MQLVKVDRLNCAHFHGLFGVERTCVQNLHNINAIPVIW